MKRPLRRGHAVALAATAAMAVAAAAAVAAAVTSASNGGRARDAATARARLLFNEGAHAAASLRGDTQALPPAVARCAGCHAQSDSSAKRPVSGARPPEAADSPLGGQRAQRGWGLASGARPPEAADNPLGGQRAQRGWGLASGARPPEAADSPLGRQRAERAWALAGAESAPRLDEATLLQPVSRRRGPPSRYDEASFCRLLATGVDPAGVVVARAMPVYTIEPSDCGALWRLLIAPPS